MKNSHAYFSNKDCKYFPCHKCDDMDDFNCLFCYCPLYVLGDKCGGKFVYLENGFKDCSACMYPHLSKNYENILKRYQEIIDSIK